MAQPKIYLACVIVRYDTVIIPFAPLHEISIVVPSMSPGIDCAFFETIRIKTDGSVVRESESEEGCLFTSVPIMFACASQSAVHGDMELEEGPQLTMNGTGTLHMYRTIPYPDKKNRSLVLLSGKVNASSQDPLFILPELYRPPQTLSFACTADCSDFVTVDPEGRVTVSFSTPREVSLDNIRFVTNDSSGCDIKSRFPFRSVLFSIDPNQESQTVAGRDSDLYFPVTLRVKERVEGGVAVLTQSGSVFVMNQSDKDDQEHLHQQILSGSIAVSSIIACTVPNANYSAPKLIASLQDKEWTEFKDSVGQKLSTLVFSGLTGEPVLRCDKRDRHWRQTGQKKKAAS